MKSLILALLLISSRAHACGPWGCYSITCLAYGADGQSEGDTDTCAQENVSHLDPNNWTEINFRVLSSELTASPLRKGAAYEEPAEPKLDPLPDDKSDFWKGIAAFRANDYDHSAELFKKSSDPGAEYYFGRALLRASQKDYDGYQLDKIDAKKALAARDAFRSYAAKNQKWSASALGLVRRAEFLASDWSDYVADWSTAMDAELAKHPRDNAVITALFDEASRIDLKQLTTLAHLHPTLWLIRAYYVTRQFPSMDKPAFDLNEQLKALEADKASFTKFGDLYAWSQSVLLLKLDRAKEAYDLLQKQPVAKTNGGSLSWVILNARLLIAQKRYDEARAIVEKYIKTQPLKASKDVRQEQIAYYEIGPKWATEQTEQALDSRNFYAMTYFWENKPEKIATAKNLELLGAMPVGRIYVQAMKPEDIKLEGLDASVRKLLEPLVLAKLITIQKWQQIADLKFESGRLSPLQKAAATLAHSPTDAAANAQIGLFLANMDPGYRIFAPCEHNRFGEIKEPIEYLTAAEASFAANDAVKNPLEATLLRTMMICYKTHAGIPHCGKEAQAYSDKKPDEKIRRGWWLRLKKRFPASKEAKSTPVYW